MKLTIEVTPSVEAASDLQRLGLAMATMFADKAAAETAVPEPTPEKVAEEPPAKRPKGRPKGRPKKQAPKDEPPAITLEVARKKLGELVQAKGPPAAMAVLADFDSKSISGVPAERYAELMERVNAELQADG